MKKYKIELTIKTQRKPTHFSGGSCQTVDAYPAHHWNGNEPLIKVEKL